MCVCACVRRAVDSTRCRVGTSSTRTNTVTRPWVHAQMEHSAPHPQMLAESQPMPPPHTPNKGMLLQTRHQQISPPPLQNMPLAGHVSPTSLFSMEVRFDCERVTVRIATFAISGMPLMPCNARVTLSLWRLGVVVRGAPRWSRATPWSSVQPLTYPAPQTCLNVGPHNIAFSGQLGNAGRHLNRETGINTTPPCNYGVGYG